MIVMDNPDRYDSGIAHPVDEGVRPAPGLDHRHEFKAHNSPIDPATHLSSDHTQLFSDHFGSPLSIRPGARHLHHQSILPVPCGHVSITSLSSFFSARSWMCRKVFPMLNLKRRP